MAGYCIYHMASYCSIFINDIVLDIVGITSGAVHLIGTDDFGGNGFISVLLLKAIELPRLNILTVSPSPMKQFLAATSQCARDNLVCMYSSP